MAITPYENNLDRKINDIDKETEVIWITGPETDKPRKDQYESFQDWMRGSMSILTRHQKHSSKDFPIFFSDRSDAVLSSISNIWYCRKVEACPPCLSILQSYHNPKHFDCYFFPD